MRFSVNCLSGHSFFFLWHEPEVYFYKNKINFWTWQKSMVIGVIFHKIYNENICLTNWTVHKKMFVMYVVCQADTRLHVHPISDCRHWLVLGVCEMRADPVVFDTAVFWSNSQARAVDQEDLVMMRVHLNPSRLSDVMASNKQLCKRSATTNSVFVFQFRNVFLF